MLDDARVKEMADGLRDLARLSDPVGEIIEGWRLPNGLEISKVRIPLGVIGIIYESRPNVTVDAAGLCLKSGNATILRGGSDAINSNLALVKVMNDAAIPAGLPAGAIGIIESTDREAAAELMRLNEYIDVLIPRGGHELIRRVKRESTVPVIETGEGVCHVYLDVSADLAKAEPIVVNAKCQRPSVCNSVETLLVHKDCAAKLLPPIGKKLGEMGVELRACERSIEYLEGAKPATEDDWATEYLSLILSVKMVDSLDEAIAHIKRYSTRELGCDHHGGSGERPEVHAGGGLGCGLRERVDAVYGRRAIRPGRGNRDQQSEVACSRADGAAGADDLQVCDLWGWADTGVGG